MHAISSAVGGRNEVDNKFKYWGQWNLSTGEKRNLKPLQTYPTSLWNHLQTMNHCQKTLFFLDVTVNFLQKKRKMAVVHLYHFGLSQSLQLQWCVPRPKAVTRYSSSNRGKSPTRRLRTDWVPWRQGKVQGFSIVEDCKFVDYSGDLGRLGA